MMILLGSALICLSFGFESDSFQDISLARDFKLNPDLGRHLTVFIIVKDFMQMIRSDRMWVEHLRNIESGTNTRGRSSNVGRLEKGTIFGGVKLDKDFLDLDGAKWRQSWKYPTGITFFGKRMMVTSGNKFVEFNLETGEKKEFENEWIRHMHTLEYNHEGTKVLVTSTGYDIIMEYDLVEEKIVWEWSAWDHGFDKTPHGLTLTRDADFSHFLTNKLNERHVFVNPEDRKHRWIGLGTSDRCCHINGAFYLTNDTIGCTFAHQGQAMIISKLSGDYTVVHDNVGFAHSFGHQRQELPCEGYLISDTLHGRVDFLGLDFQLCSRVSFTDVNSEWLRDDEHLTEEMVKILDRRQFEWLQFVTRLTGNLWSAVDIKRRHIVLFDLEKEEYRVIRNSPFLSIHEMRLEPEDLSDLLYENFRFLVPVKKEEEIVATTDGDDAEYLYSEYMYLDDFDEYYDSGGVPVITDHSERMKELQRLSKLGKLQLSAYELEEFKKLCRGEYYPLQGFMGEMDFNCVLNERKLCDGTEIHWGQREGGKLTVLKGIPDKLTRQFPTGEEVALVFHSRHQKFLVGSMIVEEKFSHDEHRHSFMLYQKGLYMTLENPDNVDHMRKRYQGEPGLEFLYNERVRRIYNIGEVCVAGRITSCILDL